MTIGLIAPASAVRDVKHIDEATENLEAVGFRVKHGRHIRDKYGYLASNDANRLADFHRMFDDKKVDAIMCVRGGYGTGRIVSAIDFDLVRRNPKIFIGFSDITMLNLALLRHCKLVNFNGPMAASTFACAFPSAFGSAGMLRTLCFAEAAGSIWQHHEDRDYQVIRAGQAAGRLTGGNLSLLAAAAGTPYQMQANNAIVFIEEVDERPYSIDRMLTQLLESGSLKGARGIVVGRNMPHKDFADVEAEAAKRAKRTVRGLPRRVSREREILMNDVFYDRLAPLGVPVLTGLPFGHIDDYATLPLGVKASMETRTGDLVIEESAVS